MVRKETCHGEPSEWASVWVHILIPDLGRQRQENCTIEASLGYRAFQVSQGDRASLDKQI